MSSLARDGLILNLFRAVGLAADRDQHLIIQPRGNMGAVWVALATPGLNFAEHANVQFGSDHHGDPIETLTAALSGLLVSAQTEKGCYRTFEEMGIHLEPGEFLDTPPTASPAEERTP